MHSWCRGKCMPKEFSGAPSDLLRNQHSECNNNVIAIKSYLITKQLGAAPELHDHTAFGTTAT